jgi:hypothetical protein
MTNLKKGRTADRRCDGDQTMSMTTQEVEHIAVTAAKVAVNETLRVLGIDVSNPFEVQQDMAHLRFWRTAFNGAIGRLTMIGLIGMFAVSAFIAVIKFR